MKQALLTVLMLVWIIAPGEAAKDLDVFYSVDLGRDEPLALEKWDADHAQSQELDVFASVDMGRYADWQRWQDSGYTPRTNTQGYFVDPFEAITWGAYPPPPQLYPQPVYRLSSYQPVAYQIPRYAPAAYQVSYGYPVQYSQFVPSGLMSDVKADKVAKSRKPATQGAAGQHTAEAATTTASPENTISKEQLDTLVQQAVETALAKQRQEYERTAALQPAIAIAPEKNDAASDAPQHSADNPLDPTPILYSAIVKISTGLALLIGAGIYGWKCLKDRKKKRFPNG